MDTALHVLKSREVYNKFGNDGAFMLLINAAYIIIRFESELFFNPNNLFGFNTTATDNNRHPPKSVYECNDGESKTQY